jgi:hypothetical protein
MRERRERREERGEREREERGERGERERPTHKNTHTGLASIARLPVYTCSYTHSLSQNRVNIHVCIIKMITWTLY